MKYKDKVAQKSQIQEKAHAIHIIFRILVYMDIGRDWGFLIRIVSNLCFQNTAEGKLYTRLK